MIGTAIDTAHESDPTLSQATVPLDKDEVTAALRKVIDPEIGLNIVDLGLIYNVVVNDSDVEVEMTLTSPSCPMGPYIMDEAKKAVESIDGVTHAEIVLVWEPFWTSDLIDPRIRAMMGF